MRSKSPQPAHTIISLRLNLLKPRSDIATTSNYNIILATHMPVLGQNRGGAPTTVGWSRLLSSLCHSLITPFPRPAYRHRICNRQPPPKNPTELPSSPIPEKERERHECKEEEELLSVLKEEKGK
ncbi:unnamed protein product [Vicia faba]|uniref:Uncharacterized protein n=1 Tax=Vicia faba TaxID=3906 RepID=A0AAV1AZQ4_VICFA|nr:unnamed protein product [Vicia faba]